METTCLDIQRKVLEILENDSVLMEYVKSFSIGQDKNSRKIFPYVTVASVTENVEALCIGPGAPTMHNYLIVIQGGTYHTLPDIARNGNETIGKKGIIQLTDDIVSAVYPGDIGGMLKPTVHLFSARPRISVNSGGRSYITEIMLKGRCKY